MKELLLNGSLENRIVEFNPPPVPKDGRGSGSGFSLFPSSSGSRSSSSSDRDLARLWNNQSGDSGGDGAVFTILGISNLLDRVAGGGESGSDGRGGAGGKSGTLKRMTIAEARPLIEQHEVSKLMNRDLIHKTAKLAVEQDGIVFIDEIDKICVGYEYSRTPMQNNMAFLLLINQLTLL
jgi:hypothetical protein